ncbi:MAG: hypothetical protein LBM08_14505 [Dysgonamonadaceae bacterium]|jgi:hypothetical protein|nr:hypothetical protein [Dysgonamonadaceae bacterium]
MKQICSFMTVLLLTVFSWGTALAADLPTISPADGSKDVWYHIRLEQRIWGIWGNSSYVNGGSVKGYYLDRGLGKMISNIEDTVNAPGTRWKVVATATEGEYQLISGLGNTIGYASAAIGEVGTDTYIKSDRYYSTTLGAQVFTIKTDNGAYLGLTLKGTGGIDKSNNDLHFDKYGPDASGGAITFVEAAPLATTIVPPADMDLGDTPAGKSRTKTLKVLGFNLIGKLDYSIEGAGFTVKSGATDVNGGTAEITFSPTERKVYTAELTISLGDQSVKTALKGNADFDFPFQISGSGTDHWYYIQFERQAKNNKVLQAGNALQSSITQANILGNADKQLWKITGDWDEYYILNKAGDELGYNTTTNRYVLDDYGSAFGFDRFEKTSDWQLLNIDAGYYEDGIESTTKRYLNDNDAKGEELSNYLKDDEGNRLIFIPATTKSLIVGAKEVDFGGAPAGINAVVKKTISVGGLNTTGVISAEIKGAGAAAYSLNVTSLPAAGGVFEVSFTPPAIEIYKAQLILKSEGLTNDTVNLTGRGSLFPFTLSNGTSEHWYYIQFVRKPALAFTSNGLGETVTQTGWTADQPLNNAQVWKITGSWDNFKFVSKNGGELFSRLDTESKEENEYIHYILATSGNRHIALEKTSGTNTGWCFQNVEANEAGHTKYMNDNEGAYVGLYGYMDDGNPLNFISASGTSIIPSVTSLGYGDVTTGLAGEKTLTVTGKQTAATISYTLAGSGAAAFSITNTTENSAPTSPLPAAGGTLKIQFNPTAEIEYIATLTLSSAGAPNVTVVLSGKGASLPADFPVKISNATSTTWYTVYFSRRYPHTDGSYKVWTAGLKGEEIGQAAHIGHEDPELTVEEQLWKFVVAPSKTGYLAVSNSGLEAKTGGAGVGDAAYTLDEAGLGTMLIFTKNANGYWVMQNPDPDGSTLNDSGGRTICEYSKQGTDAGCPMGFIETALPAPVRIQISTKTVEFPKIEAGSPALYSSNLIVRGVNLTENIAMSLSGEGASAYTIIRAADSTLVSNTLQQTHDTLKVIFNPTSRQDYKAKLTLTSKDAAIRTIELVGSSNFLPAKPSTATEEVWYYIGFVRQSPQYDPPKTFTKVFTVVADTLMQVEKAAEPQDNQLWKIEGTAADGYQIINKNGLKAFYDSVSEVKNYLMKTEGDYLTFISGTGVNANKVQMYNRTNASGGSYLNDSRGLYATNYYVNDAGNWLVFTPLIPSAIDQVDTNANSPVVSSAYYNLQGVRVPQAVPGNVYIRIDTHASGKTTATKIFPVK